MPHLIFKSIQLVLTTVLTTPWNLYRERERPYFLLKVSETYCQPICATRGRQLRPVPPPPPRPLPSHWIWVVGAGELAGGGGAWVSAPCSTLSPRLTMLLSMAVPPPVATTMMFTGLTLTWSLLLPLLGWRSNSI